jgi:hypothetical protein
MKIGKKRWRPSPAFVVVATALVVITGALLTAWLNARRYRVTARVEIADPALLPPLTGPSVVPVLAKGASLPDGEVSRLALRTREAAGLLMGLSVLAVSEEMRGRRPVGPGALVGLMAARMLLPPGVKQTSETNTLVSDRATIYIRHQPIPFGIEVISIGRETGDGPSLILRLVTGRDDDSGAALFVAKKVEDVRIPRPFASRTEIVASGWSVEPLRDRSFASREFDQLNEWARQYGAPNK